MEAPLAVASEAHTATPASIVATRPPYLRRDRHHAVPIDSGPLRQLRPVRAESVAVAASDRWAGRRRFQRAFSLCRGCGHCPGTFEQIGNSRSVLMVGGGVAISGRSLPSDWKWGCGARRVTVRSHAVSAPLHITVDGARGVQRTARSLRVVVRSGSECVNGSGREILMEKRPFGGEHKPRRSRRSA